jgi:hypothetical protein
MTRQEIIIAKLADALKVAETVLASRGIELKEVTRALALHGLGEWK